jgi:hypothetical protein
MARHPYMNDFAGAYFNEETAKQVSKQHVRHLQEVTGPDRVGMVVDEGQSILASTTGRMPLMLVALDGPLADVDAKLQQFPTHPLGTPQAVFS